MEQVTIIDDICGAGKSTFAIKYILANPKEIFLYVTPTLSEVERIEAATAFCSPDASQGKGSKLEHLKELLKNHESVVVTHALLQLADAELLELIEGYHVIVDEAIHSVELLETSAIDKAILLETILKEDKTGRAVWKEEFKGMETSNYSGSYADIKKMCDAESLYITHVQTESGKEKILFCWHFPMKIFRSAKKCLLLTYLSKGDNITSYFDMNDIPYNIFSLKDGELIPYELHLPDKSLITILEGKVNDIGEESTALSKSWFLRGYNADIKMNDRITKLNQNIENVIKNRWNAKQDDIIVGTFKNVANSKEFRARGFKKSIIPINSRATNDFANRHHVVFASNIYLDPWIHNYLLAHGAKPNDNLFGLSMLIQFVFRSAIRKGEHIYLYIPSKRMREMFKEYLAGKLPAPRQTKAAFAIQRKDCITESDL